MKLLATNTRNSNNNRFSSDSEIDDREGSEPDIFNPASLNKISESIKDLCDTCIKSKDKKIVKHKIMTPQYKNLKRITLTFGVHMIHHLSQEKATLA